MKHIALIFALAAAVLVMPSSALAQGVVASHHARPQSTCADKLLLQQPANFFHETMYASIYETLSGTGCTTVTGWYAQSQISFSGTGTHAGALYSELLSGSPYLPLTFNTVNFPAGYKVSTPVIPTGSYICSLKAFVLFDQNGLGYMTTQTVTIPC